MAQCCGPHVRDWLRTTNVEEHHGTHALVQCRTPCMRDSTCSPKSPVPHPIPVALEQSFHTTESHNTRKKTHK
ncbi:hypothetical protein PIB30_056551, partial [Stylosanthes scabra]|nr:hypothetical protein [Stylosanthes scabra]